MSDQERDAAKAKQKAENLARFEEAKKRGAQVIGPLYEMGAVAGWNHGFDQGWSAAFAHGFERALKAVMREADMLRWSSEDEGIVNAVGRVRQAAAREGRDEA